MAINTSGILKSPQGSAIQNAEIIFEQTRTSTEVLAGTKFSVITNQTGNYSSSLGVGTYVFKVRFQDETQYRTVASNVIVTQSMNNYSLNQIIQDQSQLQDVDYNLLQDVIQARDQAAASKQAAQSSQATASTKASEASSSAQAALASKNAAQTSEANALASKNAAQSSQTNAASSQTAAQSSQTAASGSQTTASTKATEAANSAQAALASKNAAATSEANALASKNQAQSSQTAAQGSQTTATTKASEASTSQTQSQRSQSDSGAAAQAAATSEANALASKNQAQTSQATATTKASEASTSAQAALASKNAAATSETNALASKNQAQTSQTNASNSQTAAAASQTTATTKASEASTSQTGAAGSQTTATTKAGEASASQTSASGSQTTATTKASEASASQTSASGSQSTATTKASEASASQTLAQKWAANPENSVVSGGLYSALHYAAKAAQSAQTASGQLVWRGGWSAQAGSAPPTPSGTTQDFYRITQAGTILSVQYEVGDYIHWDNINSIWFKMDGTDSVTSVNGRTGAVVIAKADVGLNLVNNWGASSQTNDASTTTYATTAGVKAAYDLAATKLTATANAVSATKLVTAQTINGTNFDGTANITTATWGTSRNLTIGNTAKAVNGSQNVVWTLAEIGAAPDGFGLGSPTSVSMDANQLGGIVSGFFSGGGDSAVNFYAKYQPLIQQGRQGGADGSGQLVQLQADHDTRTLAYRTRVGNIWTSWGVLYSNLNKPTANDLGVVPDTRTVNGKRLNTDITITQNDVDTYNKQIIDEQSLKTVTIQAPQGVVAGKYYPIVVSNYGSDHSLFVETRSSGGADPMNYCSFDGQIHNGGWSDTGVYVYGQFTSYSGGERQIHSILGSSEEATAYAIYVEARAFPVNVRVRASANVACTGLDMSYGTTVFAQAVTNPQAGVGTKTRLLAEFQPRNYFHSGNTIVTLGGVDTQSTVIVNKDRTDVGSLALGGNIQGYAEIAGKAAGQAGYNYDQGLRYYNDGTWRIGDKKILHDGGGVLLGNLSVTTNSPAPIVLDRGTQVGIGYKYSASNTQYLAVDDTGILRFGNNINHSTNQYVYTSGNKPTAADIGALQAGGTAVAATKLATARTIGGVAFDGTANINLPGVNTAGNQSTTGNAATATKLATARTIAGVSFDGTANISLTAANVGAIATTGGTATGNITAPDFIQTTPQSTNAAASTRKDYVDAQIKVIDDKNFTKYPTNLEADLNTLGKTLDAGVYRQEASVNATTAKHYPVRLAGTLLVTPSAHGCQQEYTTFTGRKFQRGLSGEWNGTDGPWGEWTEFYSEVSPKQFVDKTGDTMTGSLNASDFIQTTAQSTNVASCTRRDYVDAQVGAVDAKNVAKAGDTMTGKLIINSDSNIITINSKATDAGYIRGQVAGVNSWYIGRGGATDALTISSDACSTNVTLSVGGVTSNKDLFVNQSKVYHQGFKPTAAEVGAAPAGFGLGTYGTDISTVLGNCNLRRQSGFFQGSNIAGIPNGAGWTYLFNQAHGNAAGYFGYLAINFAGTKAWIGGQEGGTQKGPFELVKRGDQIYTNDRIEISTGANPMLEYHIPGKHAVCTYVDGAGNYRIATSNGSGSEVALRAQFAASGELYVNGNGNFNDVYIRSDIQLKTNLDKVSNALHKVGQLQGYTYDKRKSLASNEIVGREAGIIAQDLRKVLPEAVKEAEDTSLTISNSAVTALLVEAIKELKDEIDQLRRLINGT